MKKFVIIMILSQVIAFSFAVNSENDFTYKLSDDAESVIITGFKKDLSTYDIPDLIEEMPVSAIDIEEYRDQYNDSNGKKEEVVLKLPEGLKELRLLIRVSGNRKRHFIINNLPSSLEKCKIDSFSPVPGKYSVTVKGSLKKLDKLTSFVANDVEFEDKILTVRKKWSYYNFRGSDFTEVDFEEGCEIIGSFQYCENLKKVTLPSSVKEFYYDGTFEGCINLREFIIPDTATGFDLSRKPYMVFDRVPLPLKVQAKLKKLGYRGEFGNP